MTLEKILVLDCDVGFKGLDAEWIAGSLNNDAVICKARENAFPENMNEYSGMIISGSSASANDCDEWIKRLEKKTKETYESGLPILGVCFGHQMLAKALGGQISKMQDMEIGWHEVWHNQNPFFAGLKNPFYSFQIHNEHVAKYPAGAEIIAFNREPQAFQMQGKPVYGVQFHPEIDKEIAYYVINARREKIEKARGRKGESLNTVGKYDSKQAQGIFENFRRQAIFYQQKNAALERAASQRAALEYGKNLVNKIW